MRELIITTILDAMAMGQLTKTSSTLMKNIEMNVSIQQSKLSSL